MLRTHYELLHFSQCVYELMTGVHDGTNTRANEMAHETSGSVCDRSVKRRMIS